MLYPLDSISHPVFRIGTGVDPIRQLRARLQKADSYLSAPDAIEAMKSLGVATLNIDGQRQILWETCCGESTELS